MPFRPFDHIQGAKFLDFEKNDNNRGLEIRRNDLWLAVQAMVYNYRPFGVLLRNRVVLSV